MLNQKMIDEVENKFAEMDDTPENVQWFFDKMCEFLMDEDAIELVYDNIRFDCISVRTYVTKEYEDKYGNMHYEEGVLLNHDYVGYNCFTKEQEDTLNQLVDELYESANDNY